MSNSSFQYFLMTGNFHHSISTFSLLLAGFVLDREVLDFFGWQ